MNAALRFRLVATLLLLGSVFAVNAFSTDRALWQAPTYIASGALAALTQQAAAAPPAPLPTSAPALRIVSSPPTPGGFPTPGQNGRQGPIVMAPPPTPGGQPAPEGKP